MKIQLTLFCITFFYLQGLMAQTHNLYEPDFSNKNYDTVIETALKHIKENPKDSIAYFYLGSSYADLGQHQKAILNLKEARERGLKGPGVLIKLAQSYTAENELKNAMKALESLNQLKVGFYSRLDLPIFNPLRNNERFKEIRENMYKNANPCKFNPNYRKFDFWVGEWDVYIRGQKIAESSITNTKGDCGILENWMPTNRNGGTSLSYYDSADKKWKQNWVANGSVSHYEEPEKYSEGELQLVAKGTGTWYRMVYTYNKSDDTVRQTQEASNDEGKTWTMGFDGLYKRKQQE